MARSIAFVDLDDTLFQSLRKCPPDMPRDRLAPIGYGRDGSPIGFATPRQASFLSWLSETALLVPVTARSRDALSRVRIEWTRAICAHGGLILDSNGAADPSWSSRIVAAARPCQDELRDLEAATLRAAQGAEIRVRIVEEVGVGLYLLVKHGNGDERALFAVLDRIEDMVPTGWTRHRNGNNAAFIPPFLGKEHAVAYLLDQLRSLHPDSVAIGIGDSITDAPFLALCDFAMMPSGSQLAGALLGRPE